MRHSSGSSSSSSDSSTSRSRSPQKDNQQIRAPSQSNSEERNKRFQQQRQSYQQYLTVRREKRLNNKKNYIYDISSDDETYIKGRRNIISKDMKENNEYRRQQRMVIDEITRKEEEQIRKQKLEAIQKGEHLQQVLKPVPQPGESLVAQKIKEQKQLSDHSGSDYGSSSGSDDSNDSFADQVRKINEELRQKRGEEDGSQIIGPMPLMIDTLNHRVNYGKELLPGEGAAIAYYIQTGSRIPRRGEVGLSSDDIEKYETLGYVMSGSKHKRMNAVRQRKEQQIFDAEQKKALMIFNYEQKIKREKQIVDELQKQLKSKIHQTKMA